ncbi:hypothetical protein H4Q26_000246 [Puccinia striiformis f. sp. tritici PST-130]|uniref:Uncharacterized protein n=1 Tax=Puccinia striiformis f. sp. tritici PST-78 TaxID=1165861 RepID=A0A0L0VZF3_9BASI|nr:hypothetical protein H4Q26_000246 [Puccinia striiformis f. sp. tritici PST-130]KNF04390.1 hypothetical protein PSTG_02306 [Puccinia striiformis f. sp. tritici PST-78]
MSLALAPAGYPRILASPGAQTAGIPAAWVCEFGSRAIILDAPQGTLWTDPGRYLPLGLTEVLDWQVVWVLSSVYNLISSAQFFNWEKGQDGIIIEIICLFNGGRLRKVNQGHPLGGIVRPGATSSGESVGSIIPNGSFDSCLLTASTIYPEHCMLGNGRACKHNATKRGARFDYFEKLTAPFSFHLHMESPDNANSSDEDFSSGTSSISYLDRSDFPNVLTKLDI